MFTNRFFTTLIIVALAAVFGLTVREAVLTSAVGSELTEAERIQQSLAADTAHWQTMGEYYANQAKAQRMERIRKADLARGEAMAEYYQRLMEARPYIMDSATRSYIAWGETLQAAGKLGDSGVCSNMTPENIFDGIDNRLDSGTRSYIAWGLALQAKDDIRALCR